MVAKWDETTLAQTAVVERSGDTGDLSIDAGGTALEIERRVKARKLIREFLRAVPRTEPEATLAFVRPDGTTRIVKRAELSERIDWLRPRQKQILRLGVEERWPRAKVCEYLHNISLKTFERDQVEGLDILIAL